MEITDDLLAYIQQNHCTGNGSQTAKGLGSQNNGKDEEAGEHEEEDDENVEVLEEDGQEEEE